MAKLSTKAAEPFVVTTIVIGGGHNGLVTAAFLAKAGKPVTVIEARNIIGGFCTTEELVPEAPGFLFNPTSLDHVLLKIEPSVISDLSLGRFGLTYIEADPFYSFLRPDGASICFWRDYRRTVEEIAQYSRRDAENYARLTQCLISFWHAGFPYLMAHPTRPGIKTLMTAGFRAFKARKQMPEALRILLMSPHEAINTYFESDEMRTAMAAFAASNMFPLDFPGSGIIFAVMALQHGWGVYRAVGGGGQFPLALRALIESHGGKVLTSSVVEEILISQGRAIGVRLADGSTMTADTVVGATDPRNLFEELLPPNTLEDQIYQELACLQHSNCNISTATSGLALSGLPDLPVNRERAEQIYRGGILAGESFEDVHRFIEDCKAGHMGKHMPVWYILSSFLDRSLVPEGSDGETVYAYIPAVPKTWADHSHWSEHRQQLKHEVSHVASVYMQDFQELEQGAFVVTPEDLPCFSHGNPQHPFHVDMVLSKMGPNRPTTALSGYRSPIAGLYHCGAGAHPMGTINGWSGRNVARMLLE